MPFAMLRRAFRPISGSTSCESEFKGAGWISEQMLDLYQEKEPIYFDSLTQIVMPHWCKGRVALLGDACGCLTLLAGQGSHMAMAGAYVIARELDRHEGDYRIRVCRL